MPSTADEYVELKKPIKTAYWQVWDEYEPQLGDLSFNPLTLYPDEWRDGDEERLGLIDDGLANLRTVLEYFQSRVEATRIACMSKGR